MLLLLLLLLLIPTCNFTAEPAPPACPPWQSLPTKLYLNRLPPASATDLQGFAAIPLKLPKILGEDLAGVVVEAPAGSKVGRREGVLGSGYLPLSQAACCMPLFAATLVVTYCMLPYSAHLAAAVQARGQGVCRHRPDPERG
jgi:hypothetical protein